MSATKTHKNNLSRQIRKQNKNSVSDTTGKDDQTNEEYILQMQSECYHNSL